MNVLSPIEVIEGKIAEPVSLRLELVGRSLATISEFAVSGEEVCYYDYDMPLGQTYPIRPEFKQNDVVIVAGKRRADGRLRAMAINIPDSNCIVGGQSCRELILMSFVFLFVSPCIFWISERSVSGALVGLAIAGVVSACVCFSAYPSIEARRLVGAASNRTKTSAAS